MNALSGVENRQILKAGIEPFRPVGRSLMATDFQRLANVPPEAQRIANLVRGRVGGQHHG